MTQLALEFPTAVPAPGLCPTHSAAAVKWLDWVGTRACRAYMGRWQVQVYSRGTGRVDVARSAERSSGVRRANVEDAMRLVREQRAAITDLCACGIGCGAV